MKKAKFDATGKRMVVDTGWKTFDRQTTYISTGCVISTTQFSESIRPYGETECNGRAISPGELCAFDMKPFMKYGMPSKVASVLRDPGRKDHVFLYMFGTWRRSPSRFDPFLWVVTTPDHRLVEKTLIYGWGSRERAMREICAERILEYIVEKPHENLQA